MLVQRLALIKKKPFYYLDFLDFEVDGKRYKSTHETFRNNISKFIRNDIIQLVYYSLKNFIAPKELV